MPNDFSKIDFSSLFKKKPKSETEASNNQISQNFDATSYLGEVGKSYLQKTGGQMRTDLPQISSLMSDGINKGWITLRERRDN